MDLDKKFKEDFKTQDKNFKNYLSITETDWHFDGDGKTIEMVGDTGVFVPRSVKGRIVEYLDEKIGQGLLENTYPKTFTIGIRLDVMTMPEGDRKKTIGNVVYTYGKTIDDPISYQSEETRLRFPKAWEEFKLHRGYLYHSGQWIKSSYLTYLEEQEKANGGTKSKPSGNH
jgi:hypothetical protein